MSWTTTPSSAIGISGWSYNYNSFRTTPTSTSARLKLHGSDNSTLGDTHDIEFRIENGNLVFDVNPSTTGASANPNAFTYQPPSGAVSSQLSSATVNVGDTIKLYTAVNGSLNGSFVISSEFDISSNGDGTSGIIPSGTVEKVGIEPTATVKFTISSTSPSSSLLVSYQALRDGVVQVTNLSGHVFDTPTQNSAGYHRSLWQLRMVSTDPLYETQILASLDERNKRKVYSNFW